MERVKLTQVVSPEEFLVGKTVVATGKAFNFINRSHEIISFIFSDNTFVIFRVLDEKLIFSSDDGITPDIESAKINNHPREKYTYARLIYELKLIPHEILAKYKKLNDIYRLEQEIEQFETHYRPEYEQNIAKLQALLNE